MTGSIPRTARKVKKTPTSSKPDITLQEVYIPKKYERSHSRSLLGSIFRILFVIGLIVIAFWLGVRVGFGDFLDSLEGPTLPQQPAPKTIQVTIPPNREICLQYLSGANSPREIIEMNTHELKKLLEKKTGDEFDKTFLEVMTLQNQGTLDIAAFLAGAKHKELRSKKEEIFKVQKQDIELYKKWFHTWEYDKLPPTPLDKIAL